MSVLLGSSAPLRSPYRGSLYNSVLSPKNSFKKSLSDIVWMIHLCFNLAFRIKIKLAVIKLPQYILHLFLKKEN